MAGQIRILNTMLRFPVILLTLYSLSIGQVSAEESPNVNVRLAFAIWNDGFNLRDRIEADPNANSERFYLINDGEVVEMHARFGSFGPAQVYRGPPLLVLYTQAPVPDQPLPPEFCRVELEPGVTRADIMLFMSGRDQGARYRALILDESSPPSSLPRLRLQSLYASPLYIKAGDEVLELKPFEQRNISLPLPSPGLSVQVVVRDADTQRVRPLIQRFIRIANNDSLTAFIAPSPMRSEAAELRLVSGSKPGSGTIP